MWSLARSAINVLMICTGNYTCILELRILKAARGQHSPGYKLQCGVLALLDSQLCGHVLRQGLQADKNGFSTLPGVAYQHAMHIIHFRMQIL
ncbi:hypothetical protein CBR_g22154 [Chara braunii]|uniref:Uncharacterized protein n=1 Tax=Chara braunii TaxID=69332 RepID=A0A388L293_CHABU|nr:hypothetical protein CBR_g22154 [Chara braunii]|eukprot:GBG76406.1 hypothetical protein CBR_g22154 [Chara braunii]